MANDHKEKKTEKAEKANLIQIKKVSSTKKICILYIFQVKDSVVKIVYVIGYNYDVIVNNKAFVVDNAVLNVIGVEFDIYV